MITPVDSGRLGNRKSDDGEDNGDCGIVYIATGLPYVDAAIASAESARVHAGNSPVKIHIWTDLENRCADAGAFDTIAGIENPHRRSKVDHLVHTPFRRTLFLDADTKFVGPFTDLFRLLDRFDIAMTHAHKRANANHRQRWRLDLPATFPQLNSGVLLFRRTDKVLALLDDWREAFHTSGISKDQVTLRELIWESDLQVYVLPPEFNVRYQKFIDTWDEDEAVPAILHMRHFIRK
jgi:hypothetical protein